MSFSVPCNCMFDPSSSLWVLKKYIFSISMSMKSLLSRFLHRIHSIPSSMSSENSVPDFI